MFKLIVLSLIFSFSAFAQDMSQTETYDEAYAEKRDGTSVYVGRCSTHEAYQNKYFQVVAVVQKYVEPRGFSEAQIKAILKKFDLRLIQSAFKVFDLYDSTYKKGVEVEILQNYVDDLTVEVL